MLLLTMAVSVLGKDNVVAVIARSQFFTKIEFEEAVEYCKEIDVPYDVVEIDVLGMDEISSNPADRCYLCKREIFTSIIDVAKANGINVVFEGSNFDDLDDFRPGMKAVSELGVESPLLDAELTKQDVRDLARELGIKKWGKPSSPCLATRFVIGEKITEERLSMVESAERVLNNMGFNQVRVRTHNNPSGTFARIEVDSEDFSKIVDADLRGEISKKLKLLGYDYVTIDILGYQKGSMNKLETG